MQANIKTLRLTGSIQQGSPSGSHVNVCSTGVDVAGWMTAVGSGFALRDAGKANVPLWRANGDRQDPAIILSPPIAAGRDQCKSQLKAEQGYKELSCDLLVTAVTKHPLSNIDFEFKFPEVTYTVARSDQGPRIIEIQTDDIAVEGQGLADKMIEPAAAHKMTCTVYNTYSSISISVECPPDIESLIR